MTETLRGFPLVSCDLRDGYALYIRDGAVEGQLVLVLTFADEKLELVGSERDLLTLTHHIQTGLQDREFTHQVYSRLDQTLPRPISDALKGFLGRRP